MTRNRQIKGRKGNISKNKNHSVAVSKLFLTSPSEGAQEATTSQIPEGQLPDGQWMTQSFADQIPDISGAPKEASA